MKKMTCFILVLVASVLLLSVAQAITEGDYAWEGYTITLTSINTKPMFAPAGMTDDQYPVAIELALPDAVQADENLSQALYDQARLVDESGARYAPGAATSKEQRLTLLFAVDKDIEVDALTLVVGAEEAPGFPAEYVGQWAGSVSNINLSFTVSEDGTGTYTFEQSGYTESYDFSLSVQEGTFSVSIPKSNKLGITKCEGTYAYADDELTLSVQTTFANGRVFEYTVPCRRAE